MALASEKARFSALEVGYDTDADNDIDDVVVTNPFASTSITPDYDSNGNLTYDGTYKYTYDAWNRLQGPVGHDEISADGGKRHLVANKHFRCEGRP